jgi:hypothetical protein
MKPLLKSILAGTGAVALVSLSAYFAVHSFHKVKNMTVPFGDIEDEDERAAIVWTCLGRSPIKKDLIKIFDPIAANDPQKSSQKKMVDIPLSSLDQKGLVDFYKCADNPLLNGEIGGERDKVRELFLPATFLLFALGATRRSYKAYQVYKASKGIKASPAILDNTPE